MQLSSFSEIETNLVQVNPKKGGHQICPRILRTLCHAAFMFTHFLKLIQKYLFIQGLKYKTMI